MKRLLDRPERGFTLIEIMLVVLLIAILYAIAVPAFLNARENTRSRACIGNLRHIQDAKERWAMDFRKTNTETPTKADLAPAYITAFPQCPSGGDYTIGTVEQNASCSIGGKHVLGGPN